MAIGEFGGAPALPGEGGLVLSSPMYWLWELSHAALNPARAVADATRLYYKNPINPLAATTFGKSMAAAAELFERSTRRYGRPEWEIRDTTVGGERVPVHITPVWERPFCRLMRFERSIGHMPRRPQPRLLIVAPMSGHYATLLRGTVEAFFAQPRRLRHRLGRRPHGAAQPRHLRSRRLHRLRRLDPAFPRRRHPRDRGVPAVGAGARRGRRHGGGGRSQRAALDGADGRPDRHPRQPDRGQQARRGARHRLVPPPRDHESAVPAIPASCATSIRASCSCTASSA
jgi:Poly-beta-hydroxyalkanoate depolymerase